MKITAFSPEAPSMFPSAAINPDPAGTSENDSSNSLPPSYEYLGRKVCWRNTSWDPIGTEEIRVGFSVPQSKEVIRLRLDVTCAKNLISTLQDAIADYERKASHSDKSVG